MQLCHHVPHHVPQLVVQLHQLLCGAAAEFRRRQPAAQLLQIRQKSCGASLREGRRHRFLLLLRLVFGERSRIVHQLCSC